LSIINIVTHNYFCSSLLYTFLVMSYFNFKSISRRPVHTRGSCFCVM